MAEMKKTTATRAKDMSVNEFRSSINRVDALSDADRFARTVVVGGFDHDTPKEEVVQFMNNRVLKNVKGTEETYAYNFGSVGFVRFVSREHMLQFIKDMESKPKPSIDGKTMWISTSKSPEERLKTKNVSKLKRGFVETGLAEASEVQADYKRGVLFINRVRIAEWKCASGEEKMVIDETKLKEVNITANPDKIYDALRELMSQ